MDYRYICNDCDEYFDEPNDTSYEEVFYAHGPRIVDFGGLECPYCSCPDFQETIACKFCGEKSKNEVCQDCIKKYANYENALLLQKETEDFETIITEENAMEYCLGIEDKGWFIEWLINNKGENK